MPTLLEKVQAPAVAGPPMIARGNTVTVLIGTPQLSHMEDHELLGKLHEFDRYQRRVG